MKRNIVLSFFDPHKEISHCENLWLLIPLQCTMLCQGAFLKEWTISSVISLTLSGYWDFACWGTQWDPLSLSCLASMKECFPLCHRPTEKTHNSVTTHVTDQQTTSIYNSGTVLMSSLPFKCYTGLQSLYLHLPSLGWHTVAWPFPAWIQYPALIHEIRRGRVHCPEIVRILWSTRYIENIIYTVCSQKETLFFFRTKSMYSKTYYSSIHAYYFIYNFQCSCYQH